MKKILWLLLVFILTLGVFVSCDNGQNPDFPSSSTPEETTENKPETTEPVTVTPAWQYEFCGTCGCMAKVTRNEQGLVTEEICPGHSNYYIYGTDGRLEKCRFQRDPIGSQEYDVVYETDTVAKVMLGETEYLKITYNDSNSILQKETFANNILMIQKYTSDHQIKELSISSGGEYFDYEFQFKDNLIVQIDAYMIEESNKNKVAETILNYDEKKQLSQIDLKVYEDTEAMLVRSVRYFYEADGGLIQKTYELQNSTSLTEASLSECVKYNSDLRILETARYYDDVIYVSQYEYSNDTIVSGIRLCYQEGILDEKNKIEYIYENGNQIKEIRYRAIEVLGVAGYLQVQTYEVNYSIHSFGYTGISTEVNTVVYDPNGEIYNENSGGSIIVPLPPNTEDDETSNDEQPPSLYFSGFDICLSCGCIMHEEHLPAENFPNGNGGIGQEQCLCFCYDYDYDQNGRLSKITVTDKKTLEIHTYDVVFENNTRGRVKLEGSYDYWEIQFDENGNLEQIDFRKDWMLFEMKYSSSHQISKLRQFEYGTLKELNYEFQYENERLVEICGYSNDPQAGLVLTKKISYNYDSMIGDLAECIYYALDEKSEWYIVVKRTFSFNYEEEYWLCESYELETTGELLLISSAFYTHEYGKPFKIIEYTYFDASVYDITETRYEYRTESEKKYVTVYTDTYHNNGYHYTSSVSEYIDGKIVFEDKRYYAENEVVTKKTVTEYENGVATRETVYDYQYEIVDIGFFTRVRSYTLEYGIIRHLESDTFYDDNGNIYIPSEDPEAGNDGQEGGNQEVEPMPMP